AALREEAELRQAALAEVRAEAATYARALMADKQRAEAARAEQEDWRARADQAEAHEGEFAARIAEAEAEAQRLAEAPEVMAERIEALNAESSAAPEAASAAAAH